MSANSGILGDRIKDTASAVSGTTVTLSNSAPTGYQTFGSFYSNADTCPSYVVQDTAGNWEVSYGGYTSSGTTLARASTPIASSNGGAQVAAFSGTVTVFCDACAVYLDAPAWGIQSGQMYQGAFQGTALTTSSIATGTVNYVPVLISQWFASANIHFGISALAAATATAAVGLYSNLNGAPNARLGQATGLVVGNQGGGATGDNASGSITLSSPQPPGLYWFAYVCASSAPTLNVWSPTAGNSAAVVKQIFGVAGTSTTNYDALPCAYTQSNATLPANASALTIKASAAPICGIAASL